VDLPACGHGGAGDLVAEGHAGVGVDFLDDLDHACQESIHLDHCRLLVDVLVHRESTHADVPATRRVRHSWVEQPR
jgi:hypothetical protein